MNARCEAKNSTLFINRHVIVRVKNILNVTPHLSSHNFYKRNIYTKNTRKKHNSNNSLFIMNTGFYSMAEDGNNFYSIYEHLDWLVGPLLPTTEIHYVDSLFLACH